MLDDHAAVEQNRAVVEEQGRNLPRRVVRDDETVTRDRGRVHRHELDPIDETALVCDHEHLAHERRTLGLKLLHSAMLATRRAVVTLSCVP